MPGFRSRNGPSRNISRSVSDARRAAHGPLQQLDVAPRTDETVLQAERKLWRVTVHEEVFNALREFLGVRRIDALRFTSHFANYVKSYVYGQHPNCKNSFSDAQRQQLEKLTHGELAALIRSVKLLGGPSDERVRMRLFAQRSLYDMNTMPTPKDVNVLCLGCEGSYFRTLDSKSKHLRPDKRLSWAMDVIFHGAEGDRFRMRILTVVGPQLDSPKSGEWPLYMNEDKTLKEEPYGVAISTMLKHVEQCFKDEGQKRVVLCAAGLDAFIGALSESEKKKAKAVAVQFYADAVASWSKADIEVLYAGKKSDEFWGSVAEQSKVKVECFGNIPEDVTEDNAEETLFVNAGDNGALGGNRGDSDHSIEGKGYGANSTVHPTHALVVIAYHTSR